TNFLKILYNILRKRNTLGEIEDIKIPRTREKSFKSTLFERYSRTIKGYHKGDISKSRVSDLVNSWERDLDILTTKR
ncbi:MAG: hypothetical protein ACPLVD_09255, partial [Dictyoglomus turgidum]